MPCGKQRVDGLSIPRLSAFFRNNSAVAGRMGDSSGLKSTRMFKKYFEKVRGSSPGTMKSFTEGPNKRSASPGGANAVRQTPERSGFPLEARGAFAERFGFPSRVRGAPGMG